MVAFMALYNICRIARWYYITEIVVATITLLLMSDGKVVSDCADPFFGPHSG